MRGAFDIKKIRKYYRLVGGVITVLEIKCYAVKA
jgi:hypothetical protein